VTLEFHPAARDELLAAVDYYEAALPGLGRRFRDAVEHATAVVLAHVEAGVRRGPPDVRRLVVVGFPYDVVYRRRGDVIQVLALAHHRRRPGYWRQR
jgi:plasmid stabilization system protein ParE